MSDSQYNSVNDQRHTALMQWISGIMPRYQEQSPLTSDAGTRRYYRIIDEDSTVIAVDADPKLEDNRAFIDISARLKNCGLSSPEIYYYNLEKGFLLVEDLGDQHLQQWLEVHPDDTKDMYQQACDMMITLQQQTSTTGLPQFNREFILFELDIFDQWFLGMHLGCAKTELPYDLLARLRETLVVNCEQQPQAFMHRDYHSRNLMVSDKHNLSLIDFQGAMLGPVTYDPGSLLKDVYAKVPGKLENQLCERHRQSLRHATTSQEYMRWYHLTSLQRHLKIMGLFCRLKYRDDKPQYLRHLGEVADHIRTTLSLYPEFDEFRRFFNTLIQTGVQTDAGGTAVHSQHLP